MWGVGKFLRSRFTALIINNKELSAFACMHFLSSSLTGRALESIRSIPITADNFGVAWRTLESRFENKSQLIYMHVSTICNLPPVSRESALEISDLRDKVNRAVTSLKNLKRSDSEILNDIFVYHVSQKLDPITYKAWKFKQGDVNHIPTYEELEKFLELCIRALEELISPKVNKASPSNRVTSATAFTIPSHVHYVNNLIL